MFDRYLKALEYTDCKPLNINDPKEFRCFIKWLEDQKVRHYAIEDRAGLGCVGSAADWDPAYAKYKRDLKMPEHLSTKQEELTWLLLYAIKLEYSDNVDRYQKMTAARKQEEDDGRKKASAPQVKSTNPLDNLDFTEPAFEDGARKLAEKLDIAYHPDPLVSMRAAGKLITTYLDKETLKEPLISGTPVQLNEGAGYGTNDPEVEDAARILRLLQIQNIRKLQTTINETIVAVQNLTADPRTDTSLGQLGRKG